MHQKCDCRVLHRSDCRHCAAHDLESGLKRRTPHLSRARPVEACDSFSNVHMLFQCSAAPLVLAHARMRLMMRVFLCCSLPPSWGIAQDEPPRHPMPAPLQGCLGPGEKTTRSGAQLMGSCAMHCVFVTFIAKALCQQMQPHLRIHECTPLLEPHDTMPVPACAARMAVCFKDDPQGHHLHVDLDAGGVWLKGGVQDLCHQRRRHRRQTAAGATSPAGRTSVFRYCCNQQPAVAAAGVPSPVQIAAGFPLVLYVRTSAKEADNVPDPASTCHSRQLGKGWVM